MDLREKPGAPGRPVLSLMILFYLAVSGQAWAKAGDDHEQTLTMFQKQVEAFVQHPYAGAATLSALQLYEEQRLGELKKLVEQLHQLKSASEDPYIEQGALYLQGMAYQGFGDGLLQLPLEQAVQAVPKTPSEKIAIKKSFIKSHADNRAAAHQTAAYFYQRSFEAAQQGQVMTIWTFEALRALYLVNPDANILRTTLKMQKNPATKVDVLVLDFAANNVEAGTAAVVTDLVTQEISTWKRSGVTVTQMEDIKEMLDHQVVKQLVGCQSDSCFSEISGALGVDKLIHGSISRIGSDGYILSLKLIQLSPEI